MTADLDAGGFDIFNLTNVNESAAVKYVNYGPITAGNDYIVAAIDPPGSSVEGSILIASGVNPVFRQTIVHIVNVFDTRANVNVLCNLTESDTPIFDTIKVAMMDPHTI